MRLYVKLALMVLVMCAGQAALSSRGAADTYFALRCLAATKAGDAVAQAQLVQEWQTKLRHAADSHATVVAFNAAAPS